MEAGEFQLQVDTAIEGICEAMKLPYTLKTQQKLIIQQLMSQRNVFGLLPTGFGKSDCFAFLPLIKNKIFPSKQHMALIISPLRSLMMDMTARYCKLGIDSIAILRREEMTPEEREALSSGKVTLIFSSPEALLKEPWLSMLDTWKSKLCCLAVDEAHCITTWGKEFRPEYKRIEEIRLKCPDVPVLALTATATEKMVKEIFDLLHLNDDDTQTVALLPDRPNIYIQVKKATGDMKEIDSVIDHIKEKGNMADKTIIYGRTHDPVIKLYGRLMRKLGEDGWVDGTKASRRPRVEIFHASTDPDTQKEIIKSFTTTNDIKVVVATVAFGMGVQVPDVRSVIHWGPSSSVLSYWQEVGRCARDGEAGKAILYLPPNSQNPKIISDEMIQFLKKIQPSSQCIRRAVLEHLFVSGMSQEDLENCSRAVDICCSNCEKTRNP